MEGVPEIVAGVARGLRPLGLWYGAITAVLGMLIWCYHDVAFATWPVPFRCFVWTWFVSTLLVVPYIAVSGLVAWLVGVVELRSTPKSPVLGQGSVGGPQLAPIQLSPAVTAAAVAVPPAVAAPPPAP